MSAAMGLGSVRRSGQLDDDLQSGLIVEREYFGAVQPSR